MSLDENLARLRRSSMLAVNLLDHLEREGAKPTHCRQLSEFSFLLRVETPRTLGDRFGLAPELLVLGVTKPVFARDLQIAEEQAFYAEGRLDPGLVVVVDPEPDLPRRLDRIPRKQQRTQRVPWNPKTDTLHAAFKSALRRVDLYDVRDPVRGADLLGRDEELHQLHFKVSQGAAIGVCGLRKVGKTSLLRAVVDQLGDDRPLESRIATVGWIDVQGEWQRDTGVLVARLGERISASAGLGKPTSANPFAAIEQALVRAHAETHRRTVLVLDEFDLLFEGGPKNGPFPDLDRFFGLLRSMSQAIPITLVLIGRDPELLGAPRLGGVTSPLLGWVSPYWVPPLDREPADNLLIRLGRRMGLDVGCGTTAGAWSWTGGHPYLHRLWGSAVWDGVPRALRDADSPATDMWLDAQEERYLQKQQVQDTVREVLDLLDKRYPDTLRALHQLTEVPEDARLNLWATMVRPDSKVIRLQQFGLVHRTSDGLRIPRLWEWATRRAAAGRRAA